MTNSREHAVVQRRLELTRDQILAFRRRVGALDARLPHGDRSLRMAAWAGLQDSMPRAAVLSLHARSQGVTSEAWEHPSLVQVWGPRYSAYVVAAADLPVFTLGRMPDDSSGRRRAEDLAARLRDLLGARTMSYGEAGRALGEPPNRLRYATTTGTIVLRWDGARQPTIRIVPPPDVDPHHARLELARRYLHVFGPTTPASFASWAGLPRKAATAVFDALGPSLIPVATPIGGAWLLDGDVDDIRAKPGTAAPARFLPSGDAFYLLQGDDRALLVPDAERRSLLWTSRVWPGAVLVDGEVVGTWRRAKHMVVVDPWRRLSRATRRAVEDEAVSLPLPEGRDVSVTWSDQMP